MFSFTSNIQETEIQKDTKTTDDHNEHKKEKNGSGILAEMGLVWE